MNIIRKGMNIRDIALFVSIIHCKLHDAAPFQLQPSWTRYYVASTKRTVQKNRQTVRHRISPSQPTLKMSGRDSGDDEYIDEDELGDWRSFRNSLLETGFSSSSSASSNDGYIGDDQMETSQNREDDSTSDDSASSNNETIPKSVSKANEELLLNQSEKLGQEYLNGVWAHMAPTIEEGGLVIRLPLEVEIYRSKEYSDIGKELNRRLNQEEDEQGNASFLTGVGADDDSKKKPSLSLSLAAAKMLFWYKKAQRLIEEELQGVTSLANENGEIDPRKLNPHTAEFLTLYLDNQESWQEVGLVIEKDPSAGTASTLTLNRPMAFKLSENLARLVLYGSKKALSMQKRGRLGSETEQHVKFLTAFENSCAVYVGGPDNLEEPSIMIHGFADLDGAREISPGTGTYVGGIPAAIDGVLSGKYAPLDFRFFVGSHQYKGGELDVAVNSNKYQPLACARALVLKQCIQLPKPLWHEILELCGGELKEISSLELMKRSDIQVD